MVNDAAKMGPITGKNDPRVTPLGRILRKTKLDELPQFFNLFLGDMTLVGPRPESPEIVALYTPSQRVVLAVKPGVTGKVQLDSDDESETIPRMRRRLRLLPEAPDGSQASNGSRLPARPHRRYATSRSCWPRRAWCFAPLPGVNSQYSFTFQRRDSHAI